MLEQGAPAPCLYLAGLVSLGEGVLMTLEHPVAQQFKVRFGHLEMQCPALDAVATMNVPDQLCAERQGARSSMSRLPVKVAPTVSRAAGPRRPGHRATGCVPDIRAHPS